MPYQYLAARHGALFAGCLPSVNGPFQCAIIELVGSRTLHNAESDNLHYVRALNCCKCRKGLVLRGLNTWIMRGGLVNSRLFQ